TLKSRGASDTQLLTAYGMNGLLLSALVAVPAPLLAGVLAIAIVSRIIPLPPDPRGSSVSALYQHYLLSSTPPQVLLLPLLVGALLCTGTLLAVALQTARMDVLALRREQGRSSAAPFWRRYYLDVGLAVLCAAGYLELGNFGSLS